MGYRDELFVNGYLNSELLKKEKWLYFLVVTDNNAINREHIDVIDEITGKETLEYVFRSIDILDSMKLDEGRKKILLTVLQWSEVSKGGTNAQRRQWEEKGYPLYVHNVASSYIFRDNYDIDNPDYNMIFTMLYTHGLIGQNIRGESSIAENKPLYELTKTMDEKQIEEFKHLLFILNECIVAAASRKIWEVIKDEARLIIDHICEGKFEEYVTYDRLVRLSCQFKKTSQEVISFFNENVFTKYQLWYFNSALGSFSDEQIVLIFKKIFEHKDIDKVTHINFKPLADSLYYDYEGKRHTNVYKLRIIEKYLKDNSIENVDVKLSVKNSTMSVDFEFSKVCEKLIDFCVEAERSGLLSFEKSINVLYEMFGFKRDEFDRLNNEEKYLDTMNDASSTKKSIADYVVGKTVVDVGSGGGIMLDLLEEKYPDKTIIGTDISTNVLNVLNEKKVRENHKWNAIKHNFVDGPLENEVDSIIFSSIIHEIFSYNETENGRFDIMSVQNALKNAYDSLKPGGRIIIRDGVKTDSTDILNIEFYGKYGLEFFNNYERDFEGLPGIDRRITKNGLKVSGDINFIREFLFTYTWGNESYSHEVNEQFGYFTLKEFVEFFKGIGANIIESKEFLEDGYYDNLSQYVKLEKSKYPCSNCIVVVEKNEVR